MSRLVELLRRLVAIDSVNPDLVPGGAGEAEIGHFVADQLRSEGLEVRVDEAAPGRPSVVAVARGTGGGRSLMLNAHLDTVGVAGMECPHEPTVVDNRLYGRGAYDMKGGLAAAMGVVAAAQDLRLRGDVILTAVADEEYASIGTRSLVERWTADAAIVTESTGLRLCVAHKGFIWMEVEITGKAAHGSRPDLGVDAIAKMGRVLVELERLDLSLRSSPVHRLLHSGSIHASLIRGGQERSSYPEHCGLSLERRTIPGETPGNIEAQIRQLLDQVMADDPDVRTAVKTTLVREPFEVDEDTAIVVAMRRQAGTALGREPVIIGEPGWMDAAILSAAGIPTVVFGPGGDGAHGKVEWVDLDQVELCHDILLATAKEFCG